LQRTILQVVQYGWAAILLLQERQRPLLRPRQQLHGPTATRVAGKGIAELRLGLENLLFPSPALFFRGLPWLFGGTPPSAGAPVHKIRGTGGLRRTRAHL